MQSIQVGYGAAHLDQISLSSANEDEIPNQTKSLSDTRRHCLLGCSHKWRRDVKVAGKVNTSNEGEDCRGRQTKRLIMQVIMGFHIRMVLLTPRKQHLNFLGRHLKGLINFATIIILLVWGSNRKSYLCN